LEKWQSSNVWQTQTNENCFCEEIKSRLYSGRACCYTVQNFYSSSIQNIKIKLYRAIILPVVLYERETWSLTLRVEHGLRVFENRVGGRDNRGLEEIT
jgi:hypothetical protein